MSGYRPYMAGAREAAIRANKAQAARHRATQYEEYRAYRAERSACRYEVESFEEWLGEVTPRQLAEDRMAARIGGMGSGSISDQCYYGDVY